MVVGADRIAANGDVANKIGTYPLAVLAARHEHPLLRGGAALDARSGHPGRRRASRSRSATRPRLGAGIAGRQPAFDVTPAELVDGIFTEAGVLEAALRRGDRRVSPRAEIVAAAREMLRLGLVAGTSGNVSAREGERRAHHAQRPALRRT